MQTHNFIFMRGLARGKGHWHVFPELVKTLAPDIIAEYLDIPGNGEFAHWKTPLHADEVVSQLREQSSFVKNNEQFVFVGLSLGGMVGLHWAHLFPTDFKHLYLVNSSLPQLSLPFERLSFEGLKWMTRATFAKNLFEKESFILKMVSNLESSDPDLLEKYVRYAETNSTTNLNSIRQLALANTIHSSADLMVPLTILSSKKDRMVSPRCSQSIARHFNAPIKLNDWAGHDLFLDDPKWVIEQIKLHPSE